MTPIESIAVLIVGGVGLVAVRWLFIWSVKGIAAQIVKAINGQLGLTEIRDDVTELKTQSSAQASASAALKLQFDEMSKQFERILTDL